MGELVVWRRTIHLHLKSSLAPFDLYVGVQAGLRGLRVVGAGRKAWIVVQCGCW